MLQKKIVSILFSTRLMAVLFIVFAIAMAVGTFVENSYTTATARAWIYNTHWFEAIMVLFVINFLGNIFRYKMYTRAKLPTLLLHLSFILIIIGAGITRYISYEGVMPIREGKISNTVLSAKTFLTAYIDGEIDGEPRRRIVTKELLLAPGIDNQKTRTTDFKGQEVKFEVLKFIADAKKGLAPSPEGKNYLKIVEAGGGSRHDHYLQEGQVTSIHNVLFAYNKPTNGAINILADSTGYSIKTPFEGNYMRMADMKKGAVAKDSLQPLMMRSLYSMAGMQFVFPDPVVKGEFDLVPIPDEEIVDGLPDGVVMKVTTNGESEIIKMLGGKGIVNNFEKFSLGGLDFHVRYGSKEYKLPFSIKLNDFIASKYPGTEDNPTPSYSAFKSKVELIDDGKTVPHKIYMNHVLDYEGYRFFQASFDRDEKGTILSVNHDWWGTWITYIGYTLLYIGMLLILFVPGSRFKELEKALKKVKARKKKMLSVLLVLFSVSAFSQNDTLVQTEHNHSEENHVHAQDSTSTSTIGQEQAEVQVLPKTMVDSIIKTLAVKPEHAAKFGRLVIQDIGGRMKPANTYSSQLLRKVSSNNEYEGLNSDQVLLSMMQMPTLWYNVPLIKVERKNDSLHKILKIEKGKQLVPLAEFFDARGNYKLSPYLEAAYRAKVPNQFQKDFKKADQKVNLLYSALQGKLLRIFPLPNSENNKWVSYPELKESGFEGMDSLYTTQILPLYFGALRQAEATGDYEQANKLLESLKGFQKKYGSEVMPSEEKISTEILYNKYNVFNNLFLMYLLAGIFMLIFVIVQIFKRNKFVNTTVNVFKIAILLFFLLHTVGLIARWYIAGHAPWTNAYESMIYVAWATMLFGILFGRKSDLTIAATSFVTAMILMVAHWSWLDPAIGNLVPVLDSYWLMIHVAVIVASYGPFTLGMILGLVALLLIILTNENNKKKMRFNLKEITIVNEMALTIGLVMLTIGNFLGGQWANESWGRYWGWDPKETWALISIMVYAFVIHMRLIPGMKGRFAFNWAAVFAYSSILMTYFGVNFYLTGLHSYASGDQIISYKFIFGSLFVWLVLGFFARRKYIKYYREKFRKEMRKEEEKLVELE
ncbi:MAG TPA: cytochrome c biogenesis protein CcsA [Flavobacteriaceae bacterium]|nr:cytochrome c biogenesis protein CcsA [Flavobacteriaceae bacterium]